MYNRKHDGLHLGDKLVTLLWAQFLTVRMKSRVKRRQIMLKENLHQLNVFFTNLTSHQLFLLMSYN